MTDPILGAQEDLNRWSRRETQLLDALEDLDEQEARLRGELEQVDRQIAYYESLARDMKRELEPVKLSTLLTSFARGR
ncbi:MAG TPA: hypothetical protein VIL58_01715 [Thermoplasmata archaeon]|nr:hypothetical protein [Thermoplasmata archaeon]